jgi:hypothetical protein
VHLGGAAISTERASVTFTERRGDDLNGKGDDDLNITSWEIVKTHLAGARPRYLEHPG